MPNLVTRRKFLVSTWPSAIVAAAAWISIVICIDPAGSYPSMSQGPGLTVDEIFNVEQGVYLVEQTRALGWYNLIPTTSEEAFRPENGYNPDHPPLGRYWLGLHHHMTWWIAPPNEPFGPVVTACARTGSATAFALTVWLIGAFVTWATASELPGGLRPLSESWSRWAGPLSGLALVLMPRVYGHAHLAALETVTNLTCTAAVLSIAVWWSGPAPPSRRAAIAAGVVMALALLSKIQAVLIPMPVIVWALVRWRRRAILPLALWGATALVVFFLAWPYLWLDPVGHFLEYLGRTTQRATLYCYYFGDRYADKAVPWHYPFVMFAITVPVGLQVLGVIGVKRDALLQLLARLRGWQPENSPAQSEEVEADNSAWRDLLLLACMVFPLVVFALPGVAVYDGERLFLTVFPLWAIFVGRGAVKAMEITARKSGARSAVLGICILAGLQFASNLLIHPCYLSYYNLAVGGATGAEALGLELNYWGDGLTRSLLKEATSEVQFTDIEIRPSLHQFQKDDLLRQSPILRRRMQPVGSQAETLHLAFRRRADLSDKDYKRYRGPAGLLAGFLGSGK